ncbi:SRPBCC family protein [Streptosporangium sp. 'caverna']|uniref:SRPBCC family protein n=1 Tax=Streptosporangium sp. 'caverna' TaxID=2202249 RepID=UPI000D7D9461|nr:SRPBCC family protein [Streptosporangium sp. 'caverna']AWS40638.1 cyclase [Streptosporangium sp. 'caverna']
MTEKPENGPVNGPIKVIVQELPLDQLTEGLQDLGAALAERALSSVTDKVEGLTGRLTDYVDGDGSGLVSALTGGGGLAGLAGALKGGGGLMDALKGGSGLVSQLSGSEGLMGRVKGVAKLAKGFTGLKSALGGQDGKGGKGGKGGKVKLINIVESLDVGAPRRVVYNQWTQFQDFPSFTKKVNSVDQQTDEKVTWKAQVFWSHRTWESTIIEQLPDQRIIWRSKGAKGYVDGAVTFHEVTPDLTRVLLVLEYHPQGLFERTGNIWRAQGRRARLEFKHFRRHVMSHAILHPDDIEGWRGEIRDSKVVKDHETALREEKERQDQEESREPEDELEEEELQDEEPEEEEPRDEERDEDEEEPEDEEELEEERDEDEPEEEEEPRDGEQDEDEEEPERPQRRVRPVRRRREDADERRRRDDSEEKSPPRRPARRTAAGRSA